MIKQTSSNPLANLLVIAVGVLTIGISIVLGFVAFLALSAVVAVAASIMGVRMWWLRSKLRRQSPEQPSGGVIEGEYRVVDKRRD